MSTENPSAPGSSDLFPKEAQADQQRNAAHAQ
jgi:hypothetical protein